jgi:ABC-type multidrug transport system ATPase subunit
VYPNGTAALRGASFDVAGASIHGLIGANGAGKSTLIKILSGAFGASGGEMVWQGAQRAWRSPAEALHAGIATIHQHIPLANTLSVIENIFLSTGGRWRHSAQERKAFADLAETVGYDIDPDAIVGELPIGRRQMVSILQAIAANARLLIMDEPTASLSDGEREVVFDTIRRLQSRHQTSILFISHFLDEVLELCEAVTVLRDGTVVLDEKRDAIDEQTLVAAIVGKKSDIYAVKHTSLAEDGRAPLLAVENLNSGDKIHDVSFAVKPGEILGLAGLLGSGRSEILHAIFGSDVHATGTVSMADRPIQRSIRDAPRTGAGRPHRAGAHPRRIDQLEPQLAGRGADFIARDIPGACARGSARGARDVGVLGQGSRFQRRGAAAQRRQRTEGGARPGAVAGLQGAAARRADGGRGHRRQGRHPARHRRDRADGSGGDRGYFGFRGAVEHVHADCRRGQWQDRGAAPSGRDVGTRARGAGERPRWLRIAP